jgi:hypothetical protein
LVTQVGNAVPYLLAAELAATILEAATGEPAARPPELPGPCDEGFGIHSLEAARAYEQWQQEQQSRSAVVKKSREALERLLAYGRLRASIHPGTSDDVDQQV